MIFQSPDSNVEPADDSAILQEAKDYANKLAGGAVKAVDSSSYG